MKTMFFGIIVVISTALSVSPDPNVRLIACDFFVAYPLGIIMFYEIRKRFWFLLPFSKKRPSVMDF